MEDDDEFGDLYTDVLHPLSVAGRNQTGEISAPISFKSRPMDPSIGSDDDAILYGASESKSSVMNLNLKFNSSVQVKTLPAKGSGRSNFGEEDGIDILVEESNDDKLVEVNRNGVSGNLLADGASGLLSSEQVIPGLSGKLENHGTSNFEDEWESDESEDDLEIVLNDNNRGIMGMERMKGLDDANYEEGEPMGVVADNGELGHHLHHPQMMIDEQEWGGEEAGPGADGERKESSDAAKFGGGGASVPAAVPPKIGFNNHIYHHPLHSQFKYVRPGAAPIPSTAPVTAGGPQGQVRPPITMPAVAGRGRGDWRPAAVRGAVPMAGRGYGAPVWGAMSGRGYGSGLDFTLPSHKTIFEVDIDGFEEKPWKLQGIDVSDFFNFGLNEESWKEYCKHLEHLRLETTMQGKIRVYESGRAEQDFDPDLPPELVAALGHNDVQSENANTAKIEAGSSDLARASSRGRPPIPVGRPIPVETSLIDRTPSVDTRRLRFHDTDTIIEIFCGSTVDDDNEVTGRESNPVVEDPEIDNAEHSRHSSYPFNARKDVLARKEPRRTTAGPGAVAGEDLQFDSEVPLKDQHDYRSKRGRPVLKPKKMPVNDQHDESMLSDNDCTKNPQLSSSQQANESELATVEDEVNNESVLGDKTPGIETEEKALDVHGDVELLETKVEGVQSPMEQVSEENEDAQDSKPAMSSENGKLRSGSSKDNRKLNENFVDETKSPRRQVGAADNARKRGHPVKDETKRCHELIKGRDELHSRRSSDPYASMQRRMKSDNVDFRKEADVSEGSWRRRDEDVQRRTKVEETRKREHGGEISSSSWGVVRDRGRNEKDDKYPPRQDQDMRSRQREREDLHRGEKIDGSSDKRRKDVAYTSREYGEKDGAVFNYKDSSSRRKRERIDDSDQYANSKVDGLHHVSQKEERSSQKERDERHRDRNRPKESHDEILSRKEREQSDIRSGRPADEKSHTDVRSGRPTDEKSHTDIRSGRPTDEKSHTDIRSGRPTDEKSWASQSRVKDDHKGGEKEHNQKDVGRRDDHVKRRERAETEKSSQHRVSEDASKRRNEGANDEKRPRNDRPRASVDRAAVHASDSSKPQENRKKENKRKSKDYEGGDHIGQISETPSIHDSIRDDGVQTKEAEVGKPDQESMDKHQRAGGVGSSDDDQTGSKRGRSKLERWTSQKERDFGMSSSKKSKLAVISNDDQVGDKPSVEDKHLDTFEKLKKRSERFKLPMPSDKDTNASTIKKMEIDQPLGSGSGENRGESEIKPERPPRKRRWTGN